MLGRILHWPTCPACDSWRLTTLAQFPSKRGIPPESGPAVCGCRRCGIVYYSPIPSRQQADDYYEAEDGWESARDMHKLADPSYVNPKKHQMFGAIYERLTPHLAADLLARPERRVLDFGCGPGWFLDIFRQHGWQTTGLEPAPRVRQYAAHRHRMLAELGDDVYDLIVANHVLEHVTSPRDTLRDLVARLTPGGYLYLGVPNLAALEETGYLKPFISVHHLFAYTPESLTNLLAAERVRVVARYTSGDAKGFRRFVLVAQRTGQRVRRVRQPLRQVENAFSNLSQGGNWRWLRAKPHASAARGASAA